MTNKAPTAGIHIVIVDDDQLVRDFAVHTIEYGTNQEVTTFDSGFQAWEYIQNRTDLVDVIIADANIPEMDGLELLDHVKKNYPKKKFILTTSNPTFEDKASQLGADAFLSKPYDVNDLFTIVEKFFVNANASTNSNVTEFPISDESNPTAAQ